MSVSPVKDRKMDVTIYTKSNCPFCVKAKAWFDQRDISYTQIVLDDEEQRLAFYQRVSNGKEVRSVPQIFIDDKHIGTYIYTGMGYYAHFWITTKDYSYWFGYSATQVNIEPKLGTGDNVDYSVRCLKNE